ncbi:MAG: hypothetical protein EPO67_05075 [Reyranella sp.]|nr:MAG: hypothetical protein EPO67_05075 [Reyranella sp.]
MFMRLCLPALLFLLPTPLLAAPDAAQTAAICGTRTTCKIEKTYDAGRSPAGAPLSVAEVRLGVADRPEKSDEGCRTPDGKLDGGTELWLLDGDRPPSLLLALCNDGYGASGIGEDEIKVGPNRLVHWQVGGSAWRWIQTTTYSLVPWRALTDRSCSYHNISELSGITTDTDFSSLVIRSIAKDSRLKDPGMGCPDWPASADKSFTPEPEKGTYGAYNLVNPARGSDADLPAGGTIGSCVPAMTSAGVNGFVVHGRPASPAQAAEIKVFATGLHTLTIQVFDPLAADQSAPAGGSWIHKPHVEVWVGYNKEQIYTQLPLTQLMQVGIDLDGNVYKGVGRAGTLPRVERRQATDEAGRRVTILELIWKNEYELIGGVAVVYSQAEGGKQTRLVSTTGIVNNRPLYLPSVREFYDKEPADKWGRCRLLPGGRLVRAD